MKLHYFIYVYKNTMQYNCSWFLNSIKFRIQRFFFKSLHSKEISNTDLIHQKCVCSAFIRLDEIHDIMWWWCQGKRKSKSVLISIKAIKFRLTRNRPHFDGFEYNRKFSRFDLKTNKNAVPANTRRIYSVKPKVFSYSEKERK